MRRVAVTGIGLITALGTGWAQNWAALLAGRSGIRSIQRYDPSSFRCQLGAELDDFNPLRFASKRTLRMTTRNEQLAIAGASLAIEDARVEPRDYDPVRNGLFVGGNKEVSDLQRVFEGTSVARDDDGKADLRRLGEGAASAFHPLFYVEGLQSAILFHLSQAHGLMGANAYFHGTADAGATAIGRAFRSIRLGESDLVVAGGFDDPTSWWSMSKMDGLGVLSDANTMGTAAFRPYDIERTGSVLGDGAAFLVLEELGQARRRDAHVYAEITGFGTAFDGERLLTPEPTGRALSVAVKMR